MIPGGAAATLEDDNEPQGAIERTLRSIRYGLFGVLFVMAKDATVNRPWALFMMLIDWMQMMSYPLSSSPALPWIHSSIMTGLSSFLSVLSVGKALALVSSTITMIAFYIALAWILGVLSCAIWVGYSFAKESFRVLWPLKVLRTTAQLSTTALFIPLVGVLMGIYRCPPGETWNSSGWQCWGGIHILVTSLVTVVLILFACFAAVVVGVFFERNPHSNNIFARSHGRVQVAMILLKASLTLVFTQDFWISPWILVAATVLAGIIWQSLYLLYMPYYNLRMNQLQSAMAATFMWASVCLIFASAMDVNRVNAAAFAFLTGAVFLAFTGFIAADMRARAFRGEVELSSPYYVELKARQILRGVQIMDPAMAGRIRRSQVAPGDGGPGMDRRGRHGGIDDRSLEAVQEVDDLYKEALEFFPSSSMLRLFHAEFLHIYRPNRHLELQHLAAAEARSPAMDEAFIIFQRRRQLQEADSSSSSAKMNVITRVRFEKYRVDAHDSSMRARTKQVEFWNQLLEKNPDIGKLNAVAGEIADAVSKAEIAFAQLIRINSRSVAVLRTYAQFLLEVTNNPGKANRLLEEADAIEDEASRAHAEKSGTVVLLSEATELNASSESVAVVTASEDSERLGEVTTANAAALKLFGYTRREIIGKNINTLLPEPIATFHDRILRAYLGTGRTVMMNTSRTVVGLHRAGHIFPMLLSVRSMDEGFGGLMQGISSDERFVLFMSKTLRITAACQDSQLLMGVNNDDLQKRTITIDKYFSTIKEALDAQLKAQGINETTTAAMMRRMVVSDAVGPTAPTFRIEVKRVSRGYATAAGEAVAAARNGNSVARRKTQLQFHASVHLQVTPITPEMRPGDAKEDSSGGYSAFSRMSGGANWLVLMRWRRIIEESGSIGSHAKGGGKRGAAPPGPNMRPSLTGGDEAAGEAKADDNASDGDSVKMLPDGDDDHENAGSGGSDDNHGGGAKRKGSSKDSKFPTNPARRGAASKTSRENQADETGELAKLRVGFTQKTIRADEERQRQRRNSQGQAEGGDSEPPASDDDADEGESSSGPSRWLGFGGSSSKSSRQASSRSTASKKKGKGVDSGSDENDEEQGDGEDNSDEDPAARSITRSKSSAARSPKSKSQSKRDVARDADDSADDAAAKAMPASRRKLASTDDRSLNRQGSLRRSDSKSRATSGGEATPNPAAATRRGKSEAAGSKRGKAAAEDRDGGAPSSDSESGDGSQSLEQNDFSAEGSSFGKDEGRSSIGSGSSRGSAMTQLRRTIQWRSTTIEPGLWRLRQSFVWILVVISLLIISNVIVSRSVMESYMGDLENVVRSGVRQGVFERLVWAAQTLSLMGNGGIDATDVSFNLTRAAMAEATSKFAELHDELYLDASLSNYVEQKELYSAVSPHIRLEVFRPVSSADRDRFTYVGLLDAGKQLATKANTAYRMSRAQWALGAANSSEIHFLLVNSPDNVQRALNLSTLLAERRTRTYIQFIADLQFWMMVGTCAALVAIGLFVIVPITRLVELDKDDIFKIFLDVPVIVVRNLKGQAQKRLDGILRDIDEDNGVTDETEMIGATLADEESTNIDWSKMQLRARRRRHRKSSVVFLRMLLRFLLPLAVIIAYIVGIYFWDTSASDTAFRYGQAVLYAQQRQSHMARSSFFLTHAISEHNSTLAISSCDRALDSLHSFQRMHHALIYGSAELSLGTGLLQSSAQEELMLEDGCRGLADPSFDDQLLIIDELMQTHDGLDVRVSDASELYITAGEQNFLPTQLATRRDCVRFYSQLIRNGLHASSIEFGALTEELIMERRHSAETEIADGLQLSAAQLTAASVARMHDFRIALLQTLGSIYLSQGLDRSSEYHFDTVREHVANFELFATLTAIASIAAIFIAYLCIYSPSITQLDMEMKRTRAMLLLFPENVIRGVPAIRSMIQQHSAASHAVINTAASSKGAGLM